MRGVAGERGDGGRWVRDEIDYADIADFQFEAQTIDVAFSNRWPELLALLVWLNAAITLLQVGGSRIPVVGAGR